MRFDLAIFDLDGTVLNTLQDLADAGNYALKSAGFPLQPAENYKYYAGRGIDTMMRRSLPEDARDDATVARVQAFFVEYYEQHGQDNTRPYDGLPEMLAEIRRRGMKTAVLSNKPHDRTVPLIRHYFPGLFDCAYGARAEVPIKPDPAGVVEILERYGVAPERCAYIGDSGVDMRTGKASGAYTIGVLWGFRTKEELESNGADVLVDEVSALQKILVDNS